MTNDILKIQKKLIDMTNKIKSHEDFDGHCKSGEPSFTISIDNEMKWYAEIYSYLMDFHDGGRHHTFEANTYEELIVKIWKEISKQETK